MTHSGCSSDLIEEQPELPLRLPHPLAEAVGALPHEERHLLVPLAALVGQGPSHQRLPSAGGPVEQAASGNTHTGHTSQL